ncbi:MAG: pyrophosphatase PpaX [Bacillus sp. (in: firmicutes)]
MSTNIETLLFDLDGTLINTTDLIIASFTHTLDHFCPNKFGREEIVQFIGPPLTETFKKIDETRMEEMINYYRAHNLQYHDALVKEYQGVYETIASLKEADYKIGVVTTKVRSTVDRGLKLGRLDSFFDVIVSLDDVQNAKPDPEPIYQALNQLKAVPESSIMVGDSHHDILAGKNAGTFTAGVSWTVKGQDYLQSYKPDYMLGNMSDLLKIVKAV